MKKLLLITCLITKRMFAVCRLVNLVSRDEEVNSVYIRALL